MALPLLRRLHAAGHRLRLHGRAARVPRARRASCCSARARCCKHRQRRVHRRPEPVRGASAPPPERPLLPEQRRRARTSRAARDPARSRAGDQAAAAPAARLLRRDRRALRPRRCCAPLAAARPDWQICLVGPVVKIDPASLPRAPNIHYFGQRRYDELPAFLAGWDVCLLPFARNEATRFISPTKTLEYMAAGKPIVSTAIADVRRAVRRRRATSATTPEDFIAACERGAGRARRRARAPRRARCSAIVDAHVVGRDRRARCDALIEAAAARARPKPRSRMLDGQHRASSARAARDRAQPTRGAVRDHRRRARPGSRPPTTSAKAPCCSSANGTRRRLVPLDRGQRLHVRLRRPHHVLERPVRARAVPAAARRQRALAGPRGVDLQQGRVHALPVPGGAVRPAARGASRNASSARSRRASGRCGRSTA